MSVKWQNTPAFCCYDGILRMAKEFKRYPKQYEVNIRQLEADNDDELSGASLLRAAMKEELSKLKNMEKLRINSKRTSNSLKNRVYYVKNHKKTSELLK
jgi:hypothetical protein